MLCSSIFIFLLAVPKVLADSLSCASACQEAFSNLLFDGTSPTADYFEAQCNNVLRVKSIFICARHYCSQRDIIPGLKALNESCQEYGSTIIPPYNIIDNITEQDTQSLKRIQVNDFESTDTMATIVFASKELFSLSFRTIDDWNSSANTRAQYGYAMFGFWAVVLLIGAINRAGSLLSWMLTKDDSSEKQAISSASTNQLKVQTVAQYVKAYVMIPALFSAHCSEPVSWCTIPPRLQSLTIAAFVIINVVLCCVQYHLFTGNLYWTNTRLQLWRYLADRAGVLAIANIPLLWAFAMRNNVLLWLTGWNFSTFNQFHRWVARVATVEAVLHSVAYTVEAFLEGGKEEYYADWTERYWWFGAVGVICMSFLCILAIYPMRHHFYDLFLIIHIALAVVLLVALWFHIEIFDGEYNGYIWPCVGIWVFDRVLRVIRIGLNLRPLTRATAIYNSASDVIRVDGPITGNIDHQPGSFYYLYFINGLKFWESHPFTTSGFSPKNNPSKNLEFIIRPHDGFTRRLRDYIIANGESLSGSRTEARPRLVLEGPYGSRNNFTGYQTVIFFTGGTGISTALSHLRNSLQPGVQDSTKRSSLKIIRLIWVVRDIAFWNDVYRHDLEPLIASPILQGQVKLHIEVYITSNVTETAASFPTDQSNLQRKWESMKYEELISITPQENSAPPSSPASSGCCNIELHHYRPSVEELIFTHTASLEQHDRMALISCGPPRMADDIRAAAAKAVKSHGRLDFYPESFTW